MWVLKNLKTTSFPLPILTNQVLLIHFCNFSFDFYFYFLIMKKKCYKHHFLKTNNLFVALLHFKNFIIFELTFKLF